MIAAHMAVIGVGLIGGSFALAMRESGAVGAITGIDSDSGNLQTALDMGIVDRVATAPSEAVAEADIVFISTPVCSIIPIAKEIAPFLKPGCIVTDGGSVKELITGECEMAMPPGVFFVGGHPIAGTEHSGVAAAFPSLYRDRRCILTPSEKTPRHALDTISLLWQAAGAEVSVMEPGHHDRIFAEISHLPHIVAYALVHAVGSADVEGENVLSYTAGGFRDFTRIASSNPVMWRDIALMNRTAILKSIDSFSASLSELRERVENSDTEGLASFFTLAKKFRDGIL